MQDYANLTVALRTLSGVLTHLEYHTGEEIDFNKISLAGLRNLAAYFQENPDDYNDPEFIRFYLGALVGS